MPESPDVPSERGSTLVVGVDGGGTKTDVCVATAAGQVVGFASGGEGNWEGAGLDAVGEVLEDLLTTALAQAGASPADMAAAAFCLAGVDWPSDRQRLEPHLAKLGLGGSQVLTNDSFAALRAGIVGPAGCVSVAGTGGVAAGRNRNGETARTMGAGIGEGSGALGLVAAALDAIAAEHHLCGEATSLTARFLDAVRIDTVPELFEGLTRGTSAIGGDLSVQVLDAARDGDPVACRISATCGAQHGRATAGVARRLAMTEGPFEVVLAGGIHLNGEPTFRGAFTSALEAVCPSATVTVLHVPPAAGAAMLALEAAGIDVSPIHEAITTETAAARSARPSAPASDRPVRTSRP